MKMIDIAFEADNDNPQIQEVKNTIKQVKDKRMYQRYMVILYHLRGYTNKNIAEIINLCQHTVGTYVNKYKKYGLLGLELGHSPGAPRMLTEEQEKQLVDVITSNTPDEVGFPNRKNWDINIIKQWVENTFGVKYSYTGMIDAVHRLNLSYTRPTYTLAKADIKKQEVFKEEFQLLKKSY